METLRTKKSKFLVMLIIFMLLFSNFGYTIAAIATSDGFEVISKGFFQKDEIKFKTYFEDEKGKQITDITENVNGKVKLVVEILPQVEGYLKNATLRAVSADDNDINFKFTSVTENLLKDANSFLSNSLVKENPVEEKPTEKVEDNDLSNALVPEEVESEEEPTETNTVANNTTETNTVETNTTSIEDDDLLNSLVGGETNDESLNPLEAVSDTAEGNTSVEESNPLLDAIKDGDVTNTLVEEPTNPTEDKKENAESPAQEQEQNKVETPVQETEVSEEDRLVDEDATIEEISERSRLEEMIRNAILDIKLASENEISLSNIIGDTKFEVELEYKQGEKFNVADLYKNIKLQLSGTYINRDLEEVQIGKENEITVGWEYTKDITLESEYTKFSPFELEDIKGTIVENKITITRNIENEKYLPIKSTRLEIVAPQVNGKKPIAADVIANKLLATKGEDYGYVTFEDKNWKYDEANGTINVFVENENNVYTSGIDEYVIIYRYEDYIDGENSNLARNVKATVTEYSGTENNNIIKEIKDEQDVKIDVDELVTYSIGSSEGKINKSKIYANYNSEMPLYETIFTNQVNVNILTSDVLQQLKVDCSKEVYKDANGVEFEAQGIEYKQIKFNYAEISSLLSDGGEIVITSTANETLYILNKDSITKEEDCTINLNGVNGIYVYANNISKNGKLNFELTKAIKKCNYPKSVFKSISQIESRISAEVKYSNIEDRFALQTLSTSKDFEESQTSATLSINRETLSTLRQNENVEIKIELNNDKETSDLYINPSFEVVFPKYVTSVGIESINLLNECGLRVGDFETYTENDIVKMRIDLTGTQTMFSENTVTNGTNIIVNANIQVDEYTPAKQDQIKLYYCNEGVATYQSQTKWSIKKSIPNGILKETNGFDIETIKYQAPTGLIAINGIVNYDGNLSEVRSVKQGAVSKQIPINSPSRIATMELLALNNTENLCSDVVLMGRVPVKGIQDVITNEDLGTTTDVKVIDKIKEDVQNGNTTEIYYSTNPTANKDLEDKLNGWTTEIADLSTIKSYMIVIKGDVEAGSVLRFTYDFEIPENLPYESKIAGSFGAYYNNNSDVAVTFENSAADEVSLTTEAGPKIEAKLDVNIGNGTEIGEARYITYTLEVENTGSIVAENVKVKFDRPENTIICMPVTDMGVGNNGYIEADSTLGYTWDLNKLNPGEIQTYNIVVKTMNIVKNIDNAYAVAKAIVSAQNLGITIESNELRNKIVKSMFDIEVNSSLLPPIDSGINVTYNGSIRNISGEKLNNVKAEWTIPTTVNFIASEQENPGWTYDAERRVATMVIDEIDKNQVKSTSVKVKSASGNKEQLTNYLTLTTDNGIVERSSDINLLYRGVELEATQSSNITSGNVLERENVEFLIKFKNVGNGDGQKVTVIDDISPNLEKVSASVIETNQTLSIVNNKIEHNTILKIGEELTLRISGVAADLDGQNKTIVNKAKIGFNVDNLVETNEIQINIQENKQKEEIPAENNHYSNKPGTSNDDNTSTAKPQNSTSDNKIEKGTKSISGIVWLDKDRNGRRDNSESAIASIPVYLYKGESMIQSTSTNKSGKYTFRNLPEGDYYIVFEYDANKYAVTEYQKANIEAELNSNAVETSEGKATTSTITIGNDNISNINLGLQEKTKFDLTIEKVITKATVITDKKQEETKFNDEALGKIEIRASELKKSKVELEYKINIINSGDAQGKATSIIDIIPEGMNFEESKNPGWTLGSDGILYNNSLRDINIAPGEKKELKLVLTKNMTEENTGAVSNKTQILATETSTELLENTENNVATQEMLILIKTGRSFQYVLIVFLATIFMIGIYYNRDKIVTIVSSNKSTYKNKEKDRKKISIKKKYK